MNPYAELEAALAEIGTIYAAMDPTTDQARVVALLGLYGEILSGLVDRTRTVIEVEAEKKRRGQKEAPRGRGDGPFFRVNNPF